MMQLEIGHPAPDFSLKDLMGRRVSLEALRGKIVLINFWSCECPWSARADRNLGLWQATWGERVAWLSVASNANEDRDKILQAARDRHLPMVLLDDAQAVADYYQAQITPHAFILDERGILRYRGGIDDSSIRQRRPTRMYAFEAVQSLLAGKSPPLAAFDPFGCALVRMSREA